VIGPKSCAHCGGPFESKRRTARFCGAKCRNRAKREANREKLRAQARAWRAANPEKVKAQQRAWRAANPEKAEAKRRAWRKANPEKAEAQQRAWREANPEKVGAHRQHQSTNRVKQDNRARIAADQHAAMRAVQEILSGTIPT